MMMSAPADAASLACARVCTWQMILHPAALIRPVKRGGIAKRQHHGCRSGVERHIKSRGIAFERPGNKANADADVARLAKLLTDRRPTGLARADHAETAGSRDGGGKLATRRRSHRRKQDRMFDRQQARERGFYPRHVRPYEVRGCRAELEITARDCRSPGGSRPGGRRADGAGRAVPRAVRWCRA